MAITTRVFQTNRTQAVRLPKDVAFPDTVDEVEIVAIGEARVITPKGRRWRGFFADGPFVDDGFLSDRARPGPQQRDDL